MVHAYIRGRLGNQLFQYAFIRAMQNKKPSMRVAYHFNEVYSHGTPADGWDNSLKLFNVVDVDDTQIKPKLSILQRLALKLYWRNYPHESSIDIINKYQMKWVNFLSKFNLFYLDLGYFNFPLPNDRADAIVSGNFESEKYFQEIRDLLLKELTPKYPPLSHNTNLLDRIHATNSVCISIRRGDYISNQSINKLHNICNQNYFDAAIKKMGELIKEPVFFFFSDDIDWVKSNIKIPYQAYYEKGDDPIWEKLRLMYSCKHFIISNSTFSWWAQYLGTFQDKKVIAPSRWYNNPFRTDLYMNDWELIKVD